MALVEHQNLWLEATITTRESGSEAGALPGGDVIIMWKKTYIFPMPLILGLCPPMRKNNATSVFVASMAPEIGSNRSRKVVLGASDDAFEVGT